MLTLGFKWEERIHICIYLGLCVENWKKFMTSENASLCEAGRMGGGGGVSPGACVHFVLVLETCDYITESKIKYKNILKE